MTGAEELKRDRLIGAQVKLWREISDLSQGAVAAAMGWNRPTLSELEIGIRSLKARELLRLAYILDVSVDELLKGTQ